MASTGGQEFKSDDDPWRVSAFISALMELVLSVLLLLGAAIAFITSQLVKFFGLEPPCTYIGCSHTLLPHSSMHRRCSVHGLHYTKEDSANELCPEDSWGYGKLHTEDFLSSNDDTDGCLLSETDDSSSGGLNALTSDLDVCGYHHVDESYEHKSVNCSCSASSSPIYKKSSRPKYVKSKDSIFGGNGTAQEEYMPLFSTRSVSACSSHSDDEDECETSSTSSCNNKMPSSRKLKCLQKVIHTPRDTSVHSFERVSGNSEDGHYYMLLEGEDEEICEALFFDSFEVISRDSNDHCYMLLEDEDEDASDVPARGILQLAESEQPLLQFVADGELQGAKVSTTFECANKVADAVVVLDSSGPSDIEQPTGGSAQCELAEDSRELTESSRENTCTTTCGLSSRPNEVRITGDLSLPQKVSPVESVVEDEMLDAWGKGHMKEGLAAFQMNTDFVQGSGNINSGNSDEAICDTSDVCSRNVGLVQTLMDESMSVPVSTRIAGNATCNINNIPNSKDVNEASTAADVQGAHDDILSKKGVKEGCSIFDDFVHETEGQCDGQTMSKASSESVIQEGTHEDVLRTHEDLQRTHEDVLPNKDVEFILDDYVHETKGQCDGQTISKASFESVIREAMDQYLVSFRGCLMEDKVARSVSSLENIEDYLDVVKGNSLEEESIEKPDLMASSQKDASTPKEVVLKDCSEGVGSNVTFTETQEKDQSSHVKDAERGAEQREMCLEQVVLPLQADQVKEETALEEDQEEGLDAVREALRAERTILAALETELENERNAAAIATSEAMAMISRLQEEKSAMQMEVKQLQRMSEEKADYDEKAMDLLKEILFKREKEKHALEKEVEMYRERLLAEKVEMAKRSSAGHEGKDLLISSLTPVLLIRGTDEDHDAFSPDGRIDRLKGLPSLQDFYDPGITSSPHITSMGQNMGDPGITSSPHRKSMQQNMGQEENFGSSPRSAELKETKRSRNFHLNDHKEHQGALVDPFIGGPNLLHDTHQELRGTSRSIFSTNEEEAQFILERLWVLEEELQELRGQDGLGAQKHSKRSSEGQHFDASPMKRRSDRSCADSCSAQCVDRERGETDGNGAGMLLPVHDVYEVQLSPNHRRQEELSLNHRGQEVEGSDILNYSQIIMEDFEPSPNEDYMTKAAREGHSPQVLSHARRLSPPVEMQCDSAFIRKQDIVCADDSHTQRLQATEGRLVTTDVMQQLAVRLQVLETDRELLREVLESFKNRNAELNLLQEIAQHLRELRMAGFGRASAGGELQGPFSPTFGKSCARALKKRRYCGGPGQSQILLLQQKSI